MVSIAPTFHRARAPLRRALSIKTCTARGFATVPPGPNEPSQPAPTKRKTYFKDTTIASFSDFVGGASEPLSTTEAYSLRTAEVGPEGKKRTITRLPEWLKTPIPAGNDNFKAI